MRISRILLPVGCCVAAVAAGWFMATEGNIITSVVRMAAVAGFFVSVVSPRLGLYVLVGMAAYLDCVKRFIILPTGGASMTDVASVLGAAPVTFAGVCIGVFVGKILKHVSMDRRDRFLFFAVAATEIVLAASAYRGYRNSGSMSVLAGFAGGGVYVPLVLVMGLVFRTREELLNFIYFALLIFAPVAFYGIWQAKFGFTRLEYQYLASGLTQTAGNLDDLRPRPFSTLSSPHAFAVTMAILFLLTLLLVKKTARPRFDPGGLFLKYLLPLLYFTASLASFVRSGWAVWMFGLLGMLFFRGRARTLFFYGGFVVSLVLVVFNADVLLDRLGDLQALLPSGNSFFTSAFRLETYSARLYSYQNLLNNGDLWTWFGNSSLAASRVVQNNELSHDAITQTLVSFGVVGLAIILYVGVASFAWLHERVLRLRAGRERAWGVGLLSILAGIMASGLLTGNHLAVYPLSFLFWALAGTLVRHIRLNEEPALAQEPLYSPARDVGAARGAPLFS